MTIELTIEWEMHEPTYGVHKMATLLGMHKRGLSLNLR